MVFLVFRAGPVGSVLIWLFHHGTTATRRNPITG